MKLAVIGQGYVGKSYADWLDSRGHSVIRYSLDPLYRGNRERVADAELVLIAVPTPTTPAGQDISAVREAVGLTKPGATIVIKSTVLPGTTDALQRQLPDRAILHAPEFLRAAHAAEDVARPSRTVIGLPADAPAGADRAVRLVIDTLPKALALFKTSARTAEFIKYAANAMLVAKVVIANALHDIAPEGADWATIARALASDPRIGPSHLLPTANGKRGAGGHCFIKDLAALTGDRPGSFLDLLEAENRRLLEMTGKDIDILAAVYGERNEKAA